jgi:hypothetical protein
MIRLRSPQVLQIAPGRFTKSYYEDSASDRRLFETALLVDFQNRPTEWPLRAMDALGAEWQELLNEMNRELVV